MGPVRSNARRSDEDGFGMIELMVASGVILVALTSLALVATSAFESIAFARQRHAALGVLDRAMEQIRALPYDTVELGLRTNDLSGDPAVTGVGTVASPYRLVATNERIPHGTNGDVTPLVPNTTTTAVGATTYTTRAYVTYFNDDTASGAYRVTVSVAWDSKLGNPGTRRVQNQAILYSPTGCLSTATHPFSAPCQAFSHAAAGTQRGQINATTSSFFGVPLVRASLDLAGTSSSMQLEQLSSVQGLGAGSGVTLTADGPEQGANHSEASTQSDNDPASPGSVAYQTLTAANPPAATLTQTAGGNTLHLSAGAGDQAASTSTVAASATNQCPNHSGTGQTDSQPCGRATSRQTNPLSMTLVLGNPGLGSVTIAELQGAPSESLSHTNRDLTASAYCAGTSGNGCVHARATRSVGTLRLGGLPPGVPAPAGWTGYLVELTGFTDTVTAEAGINAASPTLTTSGTIRFWNGSGYTTKSLAPGESESLPVATVVASSGQETVQIDAALSTGGTSQASSSATCGALPCRTSAEAQSRSPLIGTVSYRITSGAAEVLSLVTSIDLGSSVAEAKYSEPPSS